MECPKCPNTEIYIDSEWEYDGWGKDGLCRCPKCNYVWTYLQQAEILRLQDICKRIEEHDHCDNGLRCISNLPSEHEVKKYHHIEKYGDAATGVKIGHRCAANIAAEWRKTKKTFPVTINGKVYEGEWRKE